MRSMDVAKNRMFRFPNPSIVECVFSLLCIFAAIGCGSKDNRKEQSAQKKDAKQQSNREPILETRKSLLKKIDGSKGWTVSLGGKGVDVDGMTTAVSDTGQIFAAGFFRGTVDFDPSEKEDVHREKLQYSNAVCFLTSYDAAGNYLWTRTFPSKNTSFPEGLGVMSDGGPVVFIDAEWDVALPGEKWKEEYSPQAFIVKMNPQGEVQWSRKIKGRIHINVGLVDHHNNIWMAGAVSNYPVDFDPGPDKRIAKPDEGFGFIVKLDSDGNYLWHERHEKWPTEIVVTPNNELYIAGNFQNSVNIFDGNTNHKVTAGSDTNPYFGVYDVDMKLKYEKALLMGAHGTFDDFVVLHSGKILIAGWSKCQKSPVEIPNVKDMLLNRPDDSFPDNMTCPANDNSFLISLNPDGSFIDAKKLSVPRISQRTKHMALSPDGSVYVESYQFSNLSVLPEGANFHNTKNGGTLLLKLDPEGNFLWSRVIGTESTYFSSGHWAKAIATGPDGSVVVTGGVEGRADFDPGPGVDEHGIPDKFSFFITKLMPEGYYDR